MRKVGLLSWLAPVVFVAVTTSASAQAAAQFDSLASRAALQATGTTRVIVRAPDAASLDHLLPVIQQAGGVPGRALPIINARVATVPNVALKGLSHSPLIQQISVDRPVRASLERTGATIGSTTVRQAFGYDGSGVGVALIDSGVYASHDDLSGPNGWRVATFVDLVNGVTAPYDDYGHGTHVAGIIAGSGADSDGRRSGIAPASQLVVLKVLDANGAGSISNVIAALDYIHAHRNALNIRIVNLSIAAGVYESYETDPLTVAAKRIVQDGIVVVAAGGNLGHNSQGQTQYGGITSPANAPWVLAVGASSHMGTADRADDTIGGFSSRGPTAFDFSAKPDLVAPGVGIESLSDPAGTFYITKAPYLLAGTAATSFLPYLSLSGTSMAAPVVTGTIALMLQADPALTPNAVKAILEYTAQVYPGYDALTEGAGFLNAAGAVTLARFFAHPSGTYPSDATWSQRVLWGNHMIRGGELLPGNTGWDPDVLWGDASAAVWGQDAGNTVWGLACGGADCQTTWTLANGGAAVGASGSETVVWGSSDNNTVVWGSSDFTTVVWGSSDQDTVVWGASCGDSTCVPVMWNAATN